MRTILQTTSLKTTLLQSHCVDGFRHHELYRVVARSVESGLGKDGLHALMQLSEVQMEDGGVSFTADLESLGQMNVLLCPVGEWKKEKLIH